MPPERLRFGQLAAHALKATVKLSVLKGFQSARVQVIIAAVLSQGVGGQHLGHVDIGWDIQGQGGRLLSECGALARGGLVKAGAWRGARGGLGLHAGNRGHIAAGGVG